MIEEKVATYLKSFLSKAMDDYVQGVWSQVPQNIHYPYIYFDIEEVHVIPFDNRVLSVFNLKIVSRYRGQKEILSLLSRLRFHFEGRFNEKASFKIKIETPTKLNSDNVTREINLKVTAILHESILGDQIS